MPRKTSPAKLVLWADLHVSVRGPSNFHNYRTAGSRVQALMNSFGKVIRQCMKDHVRKYPALKGLRVRVQP